MDNEPLSVVAEMRRIHALEQAVIWANALAHTTRKSPEEVVAAAKAFDEFLESPKPE